MPSCNQNYLTNYKCSGQAGWSTFVPLSAHAGPTGLRSEEELASERASEVRSRKKIRFVHTSMVAIDE